MNEIKLISSWDIVSTNSENQALMNWVADSLAIINDSEVANKLPIDTLNEVLSDTKKTMTKLNKYDKENVKPILDYLNGYRKIVLDYQKESTKAVKDLKDKVSALIALKENTPNPEVLLEPIIDFEVNHVHECKTCGIKWEGGNN